MSITYLAQPEQQQKLEWIGNNTFSVLLDSAATGGQLTVGRFDVGKGEAPPFHMHTREDEIFMLISGTALLWSGDEDAVELREGGIVYLPHGGTGQVQPQARGVRTLAGADGEGGRRVRPGRPRPATLIAEGPRDGSRYPCRRTQPIDGLRGRERAREARRGA
jgi:mannose-6-phosphate isomerase-like protein (cupin superfamily)